MKLMISPVENPIQLPELNIARIYGYEGERQTILVVDDILDQRNLVSNILQPLGFNVLQAESANTALTIVENHHVDLFILDITMPEISGWQLAISLRKQNIRTPIMMLSANIHELEKCNVLEQYHNDYLSKPISKEQLLIKIVSLLPVTWIVEEQPTETIPVASNNIIPSLKNLEKLKSFAEIGFLSAFSEKVDDIIRLESVDESFFNPLRNDLSQCNFTKIVHNIDELINEHYQDE
ncbi:response regulator transcription factor [Vibrio algarum]|uniref:Response regulator n=1 Tax=Vibrio algarum TaxID=3020714 RepID=A0ABT4YRG8_9VIBR|nr:response regulator [Vibrio sp. KJ40-1]MDB1124113.1 response regulator [Vibrio sp. KJ40-1]